jgi:DNA-binding NarL/FixJ family response regulator
MTIRVVVADDHPMYLLGLAAVLAQAGDIDVVAEARDGHELLASVAQHAPDVAVTDLTMPGLGGIAAMQRLRDTAPGTGVIALTMHEDDESVFAALRAGALGYLVKGADSAEIVRAVRAVAAGEAVYGASIARRILAFHSGTRGGDPFPDLTPREREVLGELARGSRNRDIAASLGLSEKTVRNHVSGILLKLQVPDRTAAAIKAKDAGITGPTQE